MYTKEIFGLDLLRNQAVLWNLLDRPPRGTKLAIHGYQLHRISPELLAEADRARLESRGFGPWYSPYSIIAAPKEKSIEGMLWRVSPAEYELIDYFMDVPNMYHHIFVIRRDKQGTPLPTDTLTLSGRYDATGPAPEYSHAQIDHLLHAAAKTRHDFFVARQ